MDVTILNDNMIDGREFFLLVLLDLRWGEIVDVSVVTINDDDGMIMWLWYCCYSVASSFNKLKFSSKLQKFYINLIKHDFFFFYCQ